MNSKLYKEKEWMYEQYITLGKTIPSMSKEFRIGQGTICKYLKLHGIKARASCPKGRKMTWGKKVSETRLILFSQGKIKPSFLGKKHSADSKRKIALSKIGKKFPKLSAIKRIQTAGIGNPNYGKFGVNSSGWKGENRVTPLHLAIRKPQESVKWKNLVFKRDDWTCQKCGIRGQDLQSHHKKEFKTIIKENSIDSIDKGIACFELWDISNGETLCIACHRKTFVFFGNQFVE